MSSWKQLDVYLKELTHKVGGQTYVFSDGGKLQLSPPKPHEAQQLARFDRACDSVRAVHGADCLHSGKWKRHLHHEEGNWFVAEPVLAAYHLIVLFDADYTTDEWIGVILEHARPVLADLIPTLPPLDGGGRSVAAEGEP